jgi:hypothetical protein
MMRGGRIAGTTRALFFLTLFVELVRKVRRTTSLSPVSSLTPDLRHVRAIAAHRLAAFAANVRHVLPILADRGAALAADFRHVRSIAAHGLAALSADTSHVSSILADCLAALSSGLPRLVRREFVRAPFDVSRLPPLASDFALPLLIHRCEAALGFLGHN